LEACKLAKIPITNTTSSVATAGQFCSYIWAICCLRITHAPLNSSINWFDKVPGHPLRLGAGASKHTVPIIMGADPVPLSWAAVSKLTPC